jgi:hypothetical protein
VPAEVRKRQGRETKPARHHACQDAGGQLPGEWPATRREALLDPRTGSVVTLASGAPSQATETNSLRTDWLFSYRPNPGTVFFLGYGGSLSETDPLAFQDLRRRSDAFFVKLSYLFRM